MMLPTNETPDMGGMKKAELHKLLYEIMELRTTVIMTPTDEDGYARTQILLDKDEVANLITSRLNKLILSTYHPKSTNEKRAE